MYENYSFKITMTEPYCRNFNSEVKSPKPHNNSVGTVNHILQMKKLGSRAQVTQKCLTLGGTEPEPWLFDF